MPSLTGSACAARTFELAPVIVEKAAAPTAVANKRRRDKACWFMALPGSYYLAEVDVGRP